MTPEQAKQLREPFPKNAIGKMDRGHGVVLDYVGHAATTQRLLEVDPSWSWEPLALDERGLPALDTHGGLWIKLTVCGVTRLGYGDAGTKKGPNAVKEAIGDALRNAAMRFGVALDLWAKEDIGTTFAEPAPKPTAKQLTAFATAIAKASSAEQLREIGAAINQFDVPDDDLERLRHAATERVKELQDTAREQATNG